MPGELNWLSPSISLQNRSFSSKITLENQFWDRKIVFKPCKLELVTNGVKIGAKRLKQQKDQEMRDLDQTQTRIGHNFRLNFYFIFEWIFDSIFSIQSSTRFMTTRFNSRGKPKKTYPSFGTDFGHMINVTESLIIGNENIDQNVQLEWEMFFYQWTVWA